MELNRRIPLLESARPRPELALFLKFLRQRVDPDAASLGPHARLPLRRGRRVTQEELAEAIGISREWYAMLESTVTTQTSLGLLGRAADALMVTPEERARLFQLAIPEAWRKAPRAEANAGPSERSSTGIESRHGTILQAFAQMRSGAKRLWSASTVAEALEIAAEEATSHFAHADLVVSFHRVAKGRWNHLFVVDRGLGTRNASMYAEFASSLSRQAFDEMVFYPLLSEPGDVGSRDTYGVTRVGNVYEEGLIKYDMTRWSFLHARISSRRGVVGGITVKYSSARDYSDTDRAVIAALASIASLALS
jgi:transcriptional regulator with XRE-family HTH domain